MTNVLNYPGDCSAFDPDHLLGPDRFHAYWVPVSANYDPTTDRTRITVRPVPPAELSNRIDDRLPQLDDRMRLHELFGGAR